MYIIVIAILLIGSNIPRSPMMDEERLWILLKAKWYRGQMWHKFPDICLTVEEKLRNKPRPGN